MSTQAQNTNVLLSVETLANSLGAPTLLANVVQVSNLAANGTAFEFEIVGQSLPVVNGSITTYPAVNIIVCAGANGNGTDQVLMTGTVVPGADAGGGFLVEGSLVLKGNGKAGGGNVNCAWIGSMVVPVTIQGGMVDTFKTIYTGNSVNAQLISANTCNISFLAQPATTQNTNASITLVLISGPNSGGVII